MSKLDELWNRLDEDNDLPRGFPKRAMKDPIKGSPKLGKDVSRDPATVGRMSAPGSSNKAKLLAKQFIIGEFANSDDYYDELIDKHGEDLGDEVSKYVDEYYKKLESYIKNNLK